jgi:hypothetical protein
MNEPEVVVQQDAVDLTTVDDAQLEKQINASPDGDTTPPPVDAPPQAPAEQEPAVQQAPVEEPPAGSTPVPVVETLEQRLTKLEAQTREKEAFIQRQANELGMLRKIASRPQIDVEKVREEIREQFHSDPVLATKRMQALEHYEEEVRRDKILMAIPDMPSLVDLMAEVAKTDGATDHTIAAFKADPYKPPINVLHDLAVRARAYRYVKQKEAELEAKYVKPAAPPVHADPARQGSPVIRGGAPGGASSSRDSRQYARMTETDIPSMSDKELDEFLAKGRVK